MYFYFLQIMQILSFCSALQSKDGIFEGDLGELGAPLPAGAQRFSRCRHPALKQVISIFLQLLFLAA